MEFPFKDYNVIRMPVNTDLLSLMWTFVLLQCSYPVWEDFSAKATKLHAQLR